MPGVPGSWAWSASRRVALLGAVTVLVLFAAFPHRLEYPAHVVAGAGLAAVLGAVMVRAGWSWTGSGPDGVARLDGRAVALVSLIVVVGAIVSDLTLTGPFNVLDVANSTLGGLLGVAAVAGVARGEPVGPVRALVVVGSVLVVVGLLLRYPIQEVSKHWWWFG